MIGRSLGHYQIISEIGRGGMGEVYQAKDQKLGRDVAIKVLPEEFSKDPERVARFQREAILLASLNHQNIAVIHGLEESGGTQFLVLELVEGETLAAKLTQGPLSVEESLMLALQTTEALEAAHEKGIVHRDLKPANIKITPEGKVKILDFGLAKAFQGEALLGDASQSPTLTNQLTGAGVILGTASYMSPEQAKGRLVDKRSDIWAFGCILYECLTGERAFTGETISEAIASILKTDPDWKALPAATPTTVRILLRQCLQRDLSRRLRDIADARLQISEGQNETNTSSVSSEVVSRTGWSHKILWGLVVLGFSLAALMLILWHPWKTSIGPPTEHTSLRLNINLPPEAPLAPAGALPLTIGRPMIALSPDGRYLAYVAWVGDCTRLYVRNMITAEFRAITNSEDARYPFFSPNGQWIGFFSGTKLKKASLSGGEPVLLADVASLENGAVWGKDDQIYFNTDEQEGISKVPASGGPVSQVAISSGYAYPEFLPTGDILVGFTGWRGIGILNSEDPKALPQMLLTNCNNPRYVSTGHLLYVVPGKLMAIRFDLKSMRTIGEAIIVLDDLRTEGQGAGQFALSEDGTLIYERGEHSDIGTFVWRDRFGNVKPVGLPRRYYDNFTLSHDGRKMAYVVHDMDRSNIYIYEFGGRETQLTQAGENLYPIWSPDDKSIIYQIRKDGIRNSYQQMIEGSSGAIPLTQSKIDSYILFFTPDRNQMLVGSFPYYQLLPALKPVGSISSTAPRIDMSQERMVGFIAIHPSGHYISYSSKLYNRYEVFVRNFPSLDLKYQVSSSGGTEERWNPNGRELIYRWDLKWYGVNVKLQPTPEFSVPRVLFEGSYVNVPGYSWDISPDGDRFLLLEDQAVNKPITKLVVITNFLEELERRLPSAK